MTKEQQEETEEQAAESKKPNTFKNTPEHKEFEKALSKYIAWRIERKAKGEKPIVEQIGDVTSLDELVKIQEAVSERFYCLKHPRGPQKKSE